MVVHKGEGCHASLIQGLTLVGSRELQKSAEPEAAAIELPSDYQAVKRPPPNNFARFVSGRTFQEAIWRIGIPQKAK